MTTPPPYPPSYTPLGQVYQGQPPPTQWRPAPQPVAPNGQPLASFADRLLAFIIDAAILTAIALIWVLPLTFWWMFAMVGYTQDLAQLANDPPGQRSVEIDFGALFLPFLVYYGASLVLGLLLSYLYFVEYQIRKGQTVGKRIMKLKIIPADPAQVISRNHLLKRWAIERVIATFVPLFSWLDGLWQLWDKPLQQCLHDKAAGTVVVKAG